LKLYQTLLYPVAKPSAWVLDRWLGKEGIHYFREEDLKQVIRMHIEAKEAEVDLVEGAGALNFLAWMTCWQPRKANRWIPTALSPCTWTRKVNWFSHILNRLLKRPF
jgi:hypothetical protein